MELIYNRNKDFNHAYSVTGDRIHSISTNAEEELLLEGSFFYQVKNNGAIERFHSEILDRQLKDIFLENTIQSFIEAVEGIYSGIHIDKKNKKIIVFSDKLKRQEIYYYMDTDEVIISTNLRNLQKKIDGYSPECIISILYLYAPKGSTIYRNISRLRYNEIIEITDGNLRIIKYGERALKILNYSEEHLEKFESILENAIISRASDKLNIVQLSGGWDSTFLISMLLKHYSSDRIKAITTEVILGDGRVFNPFEVQRSRKIAKYFNIDLDIVKVHHNSNELIDLWRHEIKERVMNQGIYNALLFRQFLMAKYLKEKYGENVVAFNGEACDSLTNFGFSQYISINHDSHDFCEYADKMKCYLYSPSFFKKILNNTHTDDFIFKMYKWYFKDFEFIKSENLPREDRIFEYLMPFVYTTKRIPFMQLVKSDFIKEKGIKEFKDWLKSEYFEEVIEDMNPDNLYYWLLRIYIDFHWQSPSIRMVIESLPNARIPFLDYNLFKFFAQMPESWGRGLEINNTKYPLKKIIRSGDYKFPVDILELPGPHSYISEDINYCYIRNSTLSKYYFENINFEEKCDQVLSKGYFDVNAIKKYINDFKRTNEEKISLVNFNLLNFLMQVE